MNFKNPFGLNRGFSIWVQSETAAGEMPYAAKLSLPRLSNYLMAVAATFALFFCGTLLFLRELEINRELQEHVLRLEAEKRLDRAYPVPDRELATPVGTKIPAPTSAVAVAAAAESLVAATAPPALEAPAIPVENAGRVTDVRAECDGENCTVRLSVLNKNTTPAEGSLLVVLETEVPRIGGAALSTPMRKRYLLFPGEQTRDDLDPNTLGALEHRSFKVNKALQTSATFKVGRLLRPIAANVYVFDTKGALLQHERRVIEGEQE